MAVTNKSPGYQIDGRVSIALDALDDEQKQAVKGVLSDRAHFIASTADRRKVRRIAGDDPLYALSIPSGLRIISSGEFSSGAIPHRVDGVHVESGHGLHQDQSPGASIVTQSGWPSG